MSILYNKKMEPKNYLKSILQLNAVTIKQLAVLLTERTGRQYTQNGLTQRINRNSITFKEAMTIAEILGYNLEFVKKNN